MKQKLFHSIVFAFVCASVIPFLRSATYGLINLDDYPYLANHALILSWQGWESLKHCFVDVSQSIWMPLTWLSYALDYALFGESYGYFHVHSILLHLLNAILLFYLLRLIFRQLPDAKQRGRELFISCAVATIFWSIHPLRCESVVFLASRKDVLSFTWELIALILWVKGGSVNTILSILCFVLGAMAKPSVMTLPALCLLVDAFIKREIRIWRYAAPFLLAVGLAAFAGWQQKAGGATVDLLNEPLWGRLLNACAAFGIYLRNTVWPQWLAVQCVNRWPYPPRFLLPGLALSAVWGWLLAKPIIRHWRNRQTEIAISYLNEIPVKLTFHFKQDPLFVGIAWFAIAIFPMLGIANFGFHAYADRFTYIPHVGLSIIVGILVYRCCVRFGNLLPTLVGGALLVVLGCVSWWQTGFWENDWRAFSRTLEIDGDRNAHAHWALANYAFEFHHDLDTFVREFERTLELAPFTAMQNYEFYVLALCEMGKVDEAHEKVKLFNQLVEDIFGKEAAYELLATKPGEEDAINDSKLSQLLRAGAKKTKFVFWLHAPDCLGLADDCLACEDLSRLENAPFYAYLLWKRALLKSDTETADRLKAKLRQGSLGGCYIRFRFLRGK